MPHTIILAAMTLASALLALPVITHAARSESVSTQVSARNDTSRASESASDAPSAPPVTARDDVFAAQARAAFADAIEQYRIPGLIVAITHRGQHRFYATGLASREDGRPVTPDTLFELGSMSKLFTALLAGVAEQRGQLKLDARVDQFLCGGKCAISQDLTLMDLATHHSGGLPLQVPDSVSDVQQLVQWLKAWHAPEPGARSYSNISIGLLGHITAQAMRMPFHQALHDAVFGGLGMTSTWIDVPAAESDRYAFGYDRKTDKPIRVTPGVLDAEAYGIKSTAADMLIFLDAVMEVRQVPEPLKAALRRTREGQFQTSHFTQDMIWEQYPWPTDLATLVAGNGYDFILNPQPMQRITPALAPQGHVLLGKTGSTNGFGGYVAVLPAEELGVVVLANRNWPNEARVKASYALIQSVLQRTSHRGASNAN